MFIIICFIFLLVLKRLSNKINSEIIGFFNGVDKSVLLEQEKYSCEICTYRSVCSDKSEERFQSCVKSGVYRRDDHKKRHSKVLRELISQLRLIALKMKKKDPKIELD